MDTGASTRYFPAGTHAAGRLLSQAIRLDGGAEARALGLVRAEPGIHAAEVARRLGVSRVAAHHALRRLERRGVVERRRDGRTVRVYEAAT